MKIFCFARWTNATSRDRCSVKELLLFGVGENSVCVMMIVMID